MGIRRGTNALLLVLIDLLVEWAYRGYDSDLDSRFPWFQGSHTLLRVGLLCYNLEGLDDTSEI